MIGCERYGSDKGGRVADMADFLFLQVEKRGIKEYVFRQTQMETRKSDIL